MGILFSLFRKYPRLSFDTDTKFDMNVSNKTLLNDAKCQGYSFYYFYAIKGKPTAGEGGSGLKKPPPYVGLHKCLSAVFRKRHWNVLKQNIYSKIVLYEYFKFPYKGFHS